MTFDELKLANRERVDEWFKGDDNTPDGLAFWTPSDWAVAMAGEAGEVCDAIKKLNRVEGGVVHATGPRTREEAVAAVAEEIADTVIYLDLLAQRLGIDMERAVKDKFNRISEREGFPQRL